MRIYVLFFSFLVVTLSFCTPVLWPLDIHCTYLLIYIYDDVCLFTYLSMCCFFSHLIHMFLYVCNFLFLFHTKMPWWVLFKVFQKNRLLRSIMPWTLFLQSFSKVYVRIRFYCIQQVIMSLVIYDFSHTSFVCCGFVMDCQRERLLGHMWNLLEHMLCKIF